MENKDVTNIKVQDDTNFENNSIFNEKELDKIFEERLYVNKRQILGESNKQKIIPDITEHEEEIKKSSTNRSQEIKDKEAGDRNCKHLSTPKKDGILESKFGFKVEDNVLDIDLKKDLHYFKEEDKKNSNLNITDEELEDVYRTKKYILNQDKKVTFDDNVFVNKYEKNGLVDDYEKIEAKLENEYNLENIPEGLNEKLENLKKHVLNQKLMHEYCCENARKDWNPHLNESIEEAVNADDKTINYKEKYKKLEIEFKKMVYTQKNVLKIKSKLYNFIHNELILVENKYLDKIHILERENEDLKKELELKNKEIVSYKEYIKKVQKSLTDKILAWKNDLEVKIREYLINARKLVLAQNRIDEN